MAWNHYQNVRHKIGCELRVSDLPSDITGVVPPGNIAIRVEVSYRSQGMATLRVWSSPNGRLNARRFTVDIVTTMEDPHWIVER